MAATAAEKLRDAAALAEFDHASVYEMLEQDSAVALLHDLNVAIYETQPALATVLSE